MGAVPTGIVTPEAVRLEFHEAGVGSRAVAIGLDWLIQGVALVLVGFGMNVVLNTATALPPWAGITISTLLAFLVIFGYPILLETLWHGRSVGKAAMGLRVVTVEGAPVRFRHAAIRAALGLVDFLLTFGFAGVIATLASRRSQRLGDMVAGTMVLRERTGAGPATAASFAVPQGAETLASTYDPTGLSRDDYDLLRAYLLRAPGFEPPVRRALGEQLATLLAPKVGAEPNAEMSADTFLAALAGRWQERAAAASPPAAPPASATLVDGAGPEPPPVRDTPEPGSFAPPS